MLILLSGINGDAPRSCGSVRRRFEGKEGWLFIGFEAAYFQALRKRDSSGADRDSGIPDPDFELQLSSRPTGKDMFVCQ